MRIPEGKTWGQAMQEVGVSPGYAFLFHQPGQTVIFPFQDSPVIVPLTPEQKAEWENDGMVMIPLLCWALHPGRAPGAHLHNTILVCGT